MIKGIKVLLPMDPIKRRKIEAYVAACLKADDGRISYIGRSQIRCVGCGKKLIEGKNIHRGFHLNVCTTCRLSYFKAMAKDMTKPEELERAIRRVKE